MGPKKGKRKKFTQYIKTSPPGYENITDYIKTRPPGYENITDGLKTVLFECVSTYLVITTTYLHFCLQMSVMIYLYLSFLKLQVIDGHGEI